MGPGLDDGSAAGPAGMTGPVERVLVVGAGVAGLAAANALAHAAVDCVVLEARERVGGRLRTVDLAGCPVDLGGSWIHHPVGNPLGELAGRVGVGSHPGNPLSSLTAVDRRDGSSQSPAEVAAGRTAEVDGFARSLDDLRSRLGPAASAAAGIEAYLASGHLSGDERRRARQALHGSVEADAAGTADDQSLTWLWTQREYDGDYFGDLPDGGYAAVVQALADGLDVRLGWPVASVEVTEVGVRVTSTSGRTETGSHVVVTVPLGVLQDGRPAFDPPLPPDRSAAIGRLGFGRYEKVALAFDEPFWRDLGRSHLLLYPPEDAEPVTWVFDLDAFAGHPVLVAHVLHSSTGHLEPSDGAAVGWVRSVLTEALGIPCPAPVASVVTRWAADPYARGAYTHVPRAASNADADLLGLPLHGRLLFAGEHTQSARLGYADGALSSGVREAQRLLGARSATLGRLTGGAARR